MKRLQRLVGAFRMRSRGQNDYGTNLRKQNGTEL